MTTSQVQNLKNEIKNEGIVKCEHCGKKGLGVDSYFSEIDAPRSVARCLDGGRWICIDCIFGLKCHLSCSVYRQCRPYLAVHGDD